MPELLQVAGALSVIVIFSSATVIKSLKGGYLGTVVTKHAENEEQVSGKLDDIKETTAETYTATKENGETIDDIGEVIFLLHKSDVDIDPRDLREKVGVEQTGTDIFDERTD